MRPTGSLSLRVPGRPPVRRTVPKHACSANRRETRWRSPARRRFNRHATNCLAKPEATRAAGKALDRYGTRSAGRPTSCAAPARSAACHPEARRYAAPYPQARLNKGPGSQTFTIPWRGGRRLTPRSLARSSRPGTASYPVFVHRVAALLDRFRQSDPPRGHALALRYSFATIGRDRGPAPPSCRPCSAHKERGAEAPLPGLRSEERCLPRASCPCRSRCRWIRPSC